jgi:prepilin peptidase CpaA
VTIAAGLALVALACVLWAAVCDVRVFEIPDSLTIILLVTAAGYGLVTPGFNWLSHLAAPALFFAIGLLLFARGWMGGGDIKLMTGIAAWTGLGQLLPQLLATAIAGGLVTLLLLLVRKAAAGRGPETTPRLFHADAPIPYAVAIAIGTGWWAWQAWPVS